MWIDNAVVGSLKFQYSFHVCGVYLEDDMSGQRDTLYTPFVCHPKLYQIYP